MPLEDFLNKLARVEARNPHRSGYGDTTPAWTPVPGKEALPCLLRPLKAEALARQGRDMEKTWIRVYFAADPGVTRNDRLVVEGRYLTVQGVVNVNEMNRVYEVDCIEANT